MPIQVEKINNVWYAERGSECVQLLIDDDDPDPSTLNDAQLKTFLFKMCEKLAPDHSDREVIRKWYSKQ
jgi:hypothetical protein